MRELLVLGIALFTAISAGLGWALTNGPIATVPPVRESEPPARSFRYWSATSVPPPSERFSAVRPPSPTVSLALWPHEALAGLPDPNVLEPGFAPLRLEEFDAGLVPDHLIGDGPRLAIGGLDPLRSRDLGRILVTRPAQTELVLANVGTEDLIISRLYAGTRALTAVVGENQLDASGYPTRPIVLPQGVRRPLTLRLEGRRLLEGGTQAKHLQIFTNDELHELFDPSDPTSHETRARLVLDARELSALHRPVSATENPVSPDEPRVWIEALATDGRGGDVVELGEDLPLGTTVIDLAITNIGGMPLEILEASGNGMGIELDGDSGLQPGSQTNMKISVEPSEELDQGRWIRRQLTIATDDPLVPLLELFVVGSWVIEALPSTGTSEAP